jgi:hypothetical protein
MFRFCRSRPSAKIGQVVPDDLVVLTEREAALLWHDERQRFRLKPRCKESHSVRDRDTGEWRRGSASSLGVHVLPNGKRSWRDRCVCGWESAPPALEVVKAWGGVETWHVDDPPRPWIPCGYKGCPDEGHDLHHFAPKNTFGDDADNWITGFLCRAHHNEWHSRMDGYQWMRQLERASLKDLAALDLSVSMS